MQIQKLTYKSIFYFALGFMVLVAILLVYFFPFNNSNNQRIGEDETLPPLYPGYKWSKEGVDESAGYRIYWIDYGLPLEDQNGNFIVTGFEWVTKITVDEYGEEEDLNNYYEYELGRLGWKGQVENDNVQFSGGDADGPTGSVRGYVKIDDGYIQNIKVSKELLGPWNNAGEIPQPDCPCEIEYRIFVSEPVVIPEELKL